jgi:predicted transcriptional regulator
MLQTEAVSQSELANRFGASRKAINQQVNELVDKGFVAQTTDGYCLNGAGAIVLRRYTDTYEEIGTATLHFLATSKNRLSVLRSLQQHSARKAELASQDQLPSRSTIRRTIDTSEELALVTRTEDGDYRLTEQGSTALQSYNALVQAFEQVIDKKDCLRNLEVECSGLPVRALEGERMVVGTPAKPLTQVTALIEFIESLDETEVDHIRTFSSYFDLRISKAFNPLMGAETRIDTISPASALGEIPTISEGAEHVKQGLDAENVHWKLYPGELPLGLLIVDDEWVVAGPKLVSNATEISGTVYSSNPEVVDWAIDLHETYARNSHDPLEHLLHKFKSMGSSFFDKVAPTQSD